MGLLDIFKSKPNNNNNQKEETPLPKVSFETLRDDGVRAMKMGQLPFAIQCFKTALEEKKDLTTFGYLAEAEIRIQNYAAARPILEVLVEKEPENLNLYFLLARSLGALHEYEKMEEISNRALDIDKESPFAKYYLAQATFHLGNPIQSIAFLTKALVEKDDFNEARFLRAQILIGLQLFKEALEDTEILTKADAENEEYAILHINTLNGLNRIDEALACAKKLVTYDPFNRDAILKLATLYTKATKIAEALKVLDEAIELQPDFAKAYTARGGIKLHLNDKAGAAEDLKKGLELDPQLAQHVGGVFSTLDKK